MVTEELIELLRQFPGRRVLVDIGDLTLSDIGGVENIRAEPTSDGGLAPEGTTSSPVTEPVLKISVDARPFCQGHWWTHGGRPRLYWHRSDYVSNVPQPPDAK